MAEQFVPVPPELSQLLDQASKAERMQADVQRSAATGESLMRKAKEESVQEASEVSGSLFRNVAVPAAQTALAFGTGGMSLPAQAAIGVGSELALQKTGLAPESGIDVALQGAIPFASKVVGAAKGAGRFIANVGGKGQMAGEQAAAKVMKVPQEAVERARFSPSKAAYEAAESGGPVNFREAVGEIDKAITTERALGSQADRRVLKHLEGLKEDLAPRIETATERPLQYAPDYEVTREVGSTPKTIKAGDMTAKAQRLMSESARYEKSHPTLAKSLRGAADKLKQTVPGLEEADRLYTRENAVDDIFTAMRKGKKVEAVDALLQDKRKGERILKVMDDKELRDIRLIASQIQSIGGDQVGLVKRAMDSGLKAFLADPNGLTVFRHAFGDKFDKLTASSLSGIMTFVRGYEAQKKRKETK